VSDRALREMLINYGTAMLNARAELLQAMSKDISVRQRKKHIKAAHDALVFKAKKDPIHVVCVNNGKCCFEQAYEIGRLDERNFPKRPKKGE
jgi:hypothetical protein